MSVFICQTCQDSIKFSKVESHWNRRCPRCYVLTCVDCGVSFPGEAYKTHPRCVSEAEKYMGALFKGGDKGKASPQDAWNAQLAEAAALPDMPSRVAGQLRRLIDLGNCPRKRPKFVNFASNSLRIPPKQVEELWVVLEGQKAKAAAARAAAEAKPPAAPAAATASSSSAAEATTTTAAASTVSAAAARPGKRERTDSKSESDAAAAATGAPDEASSKRSKDKSSSKKEKKSKKSKKDKKSKKEAKS